ncbi:EAL domain-containing protein [Roseovarius sp. A21]|uniref:EAL domain-containing protein n=1 Tax=Roseovarius bejariae TaxID=2576383 RepID=A0A844CX93_9RHOB|nr:EAL domain-containing protein [Roseovarius bejariae]
MAQNQRKTAVPLQAPGTWANAQAILGLVLDHTRDAIVVQDVEGHIEWLNPAAEAMFGWSLDEALGKKPHEFILPPGMRPTTERLKSFRYNLNSNLFGRYHLTEHQRRDGSRFWNQQNFSVIDLGPLDHQKKIVITCRDVTDQVETEEELRRVQVDLQHAAYHDDLTGLANRKRLSEYFASNLVSERLKYHGIGVLQLDVDKFKEINDTLGHAAGDATLVHIADALHAACDPNDLVCRTGGDEFLLVCLRINDPDTLMDRAERLLSEISTPLPWKDQTIRIGISIGASLCTSGNCTGEALIQRADQALYAAKNRGRGQVVLYTKELGRAQKAQQQLARDLKSAVAEDQFEVHLQPQLLLPNNKITGCEALLRWNHPVRGKLAPGVFLETARKTGLMAEVDYISMNLSLDALVNLRENGFPDMCMSINVSCAILADSNYPGLLDWALQSRGLPASSVCVEILETTILEGGDLDVVTAVDRLKRLGVRVALDDFGTGYAGLAHMSAFDIDAIKLDRSMIGRLEHDPRNRVIIRSIIRLCALLNMKVIAEGVETNAQLEILRRAKCPLIQGFHLARPMEVDAMINWLRQHTMPKAPEKQG